MLDFNKVTPQVEAPPIAPAIIPEYPPFAGLPNHHPAIEELKARPQWVGWAYAIRDERLTKLPKNPRTGGNAKTDTPDTWSTYDQAANRARFDNLPGVGFALNDDYVGFDFDNVRNPETGKLKPWVREILDFGETYAETSPSQRGVRIIARGKLDEAVVFNQASVEVYTNGRYLTITGKHIAGTPDTINEAPRTLAACRERAKLHADTWAALKKAGRKITPGVLRGEVTLPRVERPDDPQKFGATRQALLRQQGRDPFWSAVNTAALQHLEAWVPALFGSAAKPETNRAIGGYRVSSKDLGRPLQEDLAITSRGCKDFGVWDIGDPRGGKRTPIDLVIEYGSAPDAVAAAKRLCEWMGIDPVSLGWRENIQTGESVAGGPNDDPLPFIDFSHWDHIPVPEREWGVGEHIPMHQPALISGEGAAGKSLLLAQLACAHVLDRQWLGLSVARGGVLYLTAEEEEAELHRRLAACARHYGTTFAELWNCGLRVMSFAGKDALLAVPDRGGVMQATRLWHRVREAAIAIKPKMIGFDTAADVFGGNEIDRGQVRQFLGMQRGLAIASDSYVAICAHPSLTGINSGSGISGSTAWHNSVRARIYVKTPQTKEGDEPDKDLRELEFKKNNYGPLADSFQVRWRDGVFVREQGVSSLERMAAEQKLEELFLKLLGRFNGQGRNVTNKRGTSYAPAIFAKEPEAKAAKTNKHALGDAMVRLFAANKIHLQQYGFPSRDTYRLAVGGKP